MSNLSRKISRQSKCHWRIAKVAKEIAHIRYDAYAKDNAFFATYPDEDAFVRKFWGVYIDIARDCLANLLSDPNFPEREKEEVYQALLLDGRFNPRAFTSIEQAEIASGEKFSIFDPAASAQVH